MLDSDVVDEFLNDNGFSHSCAAEQSDLSALEVRFDEIDHLNSGLKHFETCVLLNQGRRHFMNGIFSFERDRAQLVDRFANHVDHSAESAFAYRNGYGPPHIFRRHAAHHAIGGLKGNASNAAFAEVLLYLDNDVDRSRHIEAGVGNVQCRVNLRLLPLRKLNVHRRTNHL